MHLGAAELRCIEVYCSELGGFCTKHKANTYYRHFNSFLLLYLNFVVTPTEIYDVI